MVLNVADLLNEGGHFSDIFRSTDRSSLYKLFVGPRYQSKAYEPEDVERRRNTFRSECAAYGIALQNANLSPHVPQCFAAVAVKDVLNTDGDSVGDQYLLDCCYSMEFIEGPAPIKIGACQSEYEHLEQAVEAFKAAGILYMLDCCVFFSEQQSGFKFIDFATHDFPPADHKLPWL